MTATWTNWAENLHVTLQQFSAPRTRDELRTALQQASGPVRVAASGHSFTPLVPTDATMISLADLDQGTPVTEVDTENATAWLDAGTSLRALSPALQAEGLAFRNLGDYDAQTLAGAISTGTHGTGRTLPCLSAEVRALELMTADGRILQISAEQDPDLLAAAQVSLGSLGIILRAKMNLQPAYKLHRRTWVEPVGKALAEAETNWAQYRNFEIYQVPYGTHALCIAHQETDAAETPPDQNDDEATLRDLKRVRDFMQWTPWLRRKVLQIAFKGIREENIIGQSYRLLANERETRFIEMEYHLPPCDALDVLQAVKARIEKHCRSAWFPIEVRRTAGDSAWLSPFQGGERVSVAVHAAAQEDYSWFSEHAEPLFREAGGRPHWGKLHGLDANDISALYPDFSRFLAVREQLDPERKFVTPYMARLFGC